MSCVERYGSLVTAGRPHIRTLNSMGQWICDTYGGQGRLHVLEEPPVRDLVQEVFEVRRQANTDTVLPYIDALSAVRLGLTSPAPVEELIPDAQGLADGFDTYRARRWPRRAPSTSTSRSTGRSRSCSSDPEARSAAQGRCRHLLVDEFQDLNAAHMLLIRLLSAPAYSCFGVGDDDQVIYGYAGATPEYLINFEDYFPGAHELRARGQLPVPARRRARGNVGPVLQRAADRQDDQNTGGSHRRRSPTSTRSSRAEVRVAVLKARSDELPQDRADRDRGLAGTAAWRSRRSRC